MSLPKTYSKKEQRKIIYLLMLVQFVNIFEFMLLVPVSPDFIVELDIISSNVGMISGTYSLTAAITGLLIASFIDRIEPRRVLIFCMSLMTLGTALTMFAQNELMLIISKIITGMCGGPATALTLTIVADVIPEERRGRAMGKVLSGFIFSAVLAVPLGLEVSRLYGWRYAFLLLITFEIALVILLIKFLPAISSSVETKGKVDFTKVLHVMANKPYLVAFTINFTALFSGYVLIPILPNYLIYNLDVSRDKLSMLYFIGGSCSFFAMRLAGKIFDYRSALLLNTMISGCFITTVFMLVVQYVAVIPVLFYFSTFMICMT
ncbi:MAG: MFS transporter, partial [Gammaproteobacteria bacterium]